VTLAFTADGKGLVAVGAAGESRLWTLGSPGVASELPAVPAAEKVVLSPTGDRVAVRESRSIVVRDVRNGAVIDRMERSNSGETQLAWSADGRWLAYVDAKRALIRDLQQRTHVVAGTRTDAHGAVAFTATGDALAYTAGEDAVFFDLGTRRTSELRVSDAKGPVQSLAVSPDGTLLAAGGNLYDGNVQLWNIASGTVERRLSTGDQMLVARVFFAPDGRTLAAITAFDEVLRLWDVATGQLTLAPVRLAGAAQHTLGAAFSPDGAWLATAERGGVALRDLRPSSWIEQICRAVNRDLTLDEWRSYVGPSDFSATCPGGLTDQTSPD
jgi:WD40 repeat protein